ncbi:MAG: hypothetical protein QXH81_03415 [Thermofilaceae archaeon]
MNEVKRLELIECELEWFRGTNTGYGAAFFSLLHRKFIKPRIWWGVITRLFYRLHPGTYLMLCWSYWNKNDPPHTITVRLVRLEKGAKMSCEGVATIRVYDGFSFANPILLDFFKAIPCYHGRPVLDFKKIYDEYAVKELIDLAKENFEYVEGEENE